MPSFDQEFLRRASRISHHGLGLSVDVYSPNIFELVEALHINSLAYGYLEIFQSSEQALHAVRSKIPQALLECHAEGLWVTQPDWGEAYPLDASIQETATHLRALGCSWFNQECASKQMAGYSFGTYLPPLFTQASAEVTASNAVRLQSAMDAKLSDSSQAPPLLLLETPPLTYFGVGDLAYPKFFSLLTEHASCGLVLDIGHVWTVYRYSRRSCKQGVTEFLDEFLGSFPLSRVVQIHAAGLANHPHDVGLTEPSESSLPPWIDTHGAPIPEVLFNMLDQVLAHPALTNLKGVAMEVDTKPIPLIVEEYHRFIERYGWWEKRTRYGQSSSDVCAEFEIFASATERLLIPEVVDQYRMYAQVVSGQADRTALSMVGKLHEDQDGLDRYQRVYLPKEIFEWGGDLREMFPRTCECLGDNAKVFPEFLQFWFNEPRSSKRPFDYFLIKIHLFVEFIERHYPELRDTVYQEADGLRAGYQLANSL